MKADEAAHAAQAEQAGARPLPGLVKGLMQAAGTVMTTSAHWI
jgi:ubiquinone biosynthesis monooxygenase Coq7